MTTDTPVKLLRLGYTESTLLFYHWLRQEKGRDLRDINLEGWLYRTSGFYDHTDGSRNTVLSSCYHAYFERLTQIVIGSDFFNFNMHQLGGEVGAFVPEFKEWFRCKEVGGLHHGKAIPLLSGKRVLIVSPFAPMMVQQVKNGNFARIHECAPPLAVAGYRYPYTFFNRGPHNNMLETTQVECANIEAAVNLAEIDSVFVSCGAYSCLVAQHFFEKHQKSVCTLGRTMQSLFGYVNAKNIHGIPEAKRSFYMTEMPEEYKPEGYETIEDGCYW